MIARLVGMMAPCVIDESLSSASTMASPLELVPLPPNIGSITSSQLIGTLLNFFLFGTLFIQVYVYNLCFPKDRVAIKYLVYFVFLSMTLCACLNAADANYWYASGFGDIVKFGQARFSPFYTPIMGSIIALAVQLFFCYRISVFRSGTMWWSGLIAVISMVQAAGGVGGGVISFIASNEQHDHIRTVLVYMWLVGDAVADLMIAATMTYLLTQAAAEPQTRSVVRGIVRLIIETNTFSASVAIVGLVLFAGMPGTDYFVCPTMVLPGIYANTLLVLLNNRAAPSRTHLRPDYPSSSNAYVSGESTANGSTVPWKVGTGTHSAATHLENHDQFDLPRRRVVPDTIGAFVAAPNPHVDDAYHPPRPLSQPRDIVSSWDDASYKDSTLKDASTAWDEESLEMGDGERSHPYGSAGTYWAQ
ncbi:hypothetical protein C8R45DRAFT_1027720 [Mycena sanguinolenta]|nr:hypothetical protein C8R45DRAFT_1027720 [Mycena sanguinolenta]